MGEGLLVQRSISASLPCLSHLWRMTAKASDDHFVLNVRVCVSDWGEWGSCQPLWLMLAIVNWHLKATGALVLNWEGETRIEYAVSALCSRQPLSVHLSIHPQSMASYRLWSPPPRASIGLARPLYLAPGEECGKDGDESCKKYSPGPSMRQGRVLSTTEQKDKSQGHTDTRTEIELRCLIYSLPAADRRVRWERDRQTDAKR